MSERCLAILQGPMEKAYSLLPVRMRSEAADVMLLAIGLQESRLHYRRQIGGPARGLWQFEKRGGVLGVLTHEATEHHARNLCAIRGVAPISSSVYEALDDDDVLAAGFARLLLWTLPAALPELGAWEAAWQQYLQAWRPGKPHPETWGGFYTEALATVHEAGCP